ncbi:MAG: hypothetical protein HFI63_11685 [Lachnospiraceae bacterium]|nr:hypothetical protein [Lachnospiraceae bacterium]
MGKRRIALWMTGILFSLMLGIGCGKAKANHIAAKKTEMQPHKIEKRNEEKEHSETTAPKGTEETEKQKILRKELGVPERFSTGAVFDAVVTVPDADFFEIVSAEQRKFGDKDIRTLVEPILGDGGLYRFEPENYEHLVRTKTHTAFRLENQYYRGEEERKSLEEVMEVTEKCLREIEKEVRKEEISLMPDSQDLMNMGDRLEGFTDWEQRTVQVVLRESSLSVRSWPRLVRNECTISGEAAKKLAEQYMNQMGISEGFVLDYMGQQEFDYENIQKAGHVVCYVRELQGVPVGYHSESGGIRFVIDDNGVEELSYRDYVVKNDGEPVTLLPFSEIEKIYEEIYLSLQREPNERKAVVVDEIRLVYHWVPDVEGSMTGRLIPAWDAFGTYQFTDEEGNQKSSNQADRECLLSVNAVDGTILSSF